MTDRLSSGNERIDDVLGGGLPRNAINLLIGPPGSGKTILAEQYLFHNATEARPGLFLSTVSEPFDPLRLVSAVKDLLGTSAYLTTPARLTV